MKKEKKPKKPLTTKQKQNRYRTGQWTLFGSEFVAVATPFVIMGAVNFDEWFQQAEGWKVTLGGSMAMALLGMAMFLVTKKKEGKTSVSEGYITLIVGWFACGFIFYLLSSILTDIAGIMLYSGLGLLGAFGLHLGSVECKKKADFYKEAIAKTEKDLISEERRAEVEKKKPEDEKEKEQVPVD